MSCVNNFFGECIRFDRDLRELWKATKEEDVDVMENRIIGAIAMTTTATGLEVRQAYDRLGSWDDVIKAARETCKGYPMSMCVGHILEERLEERLVCDKMAAAGISGAKAGRSLRRTLRMMELFALLSEDE